VVRISAEERIGGRRKEKKMAEFGGPYRINANETDSVNKPAGDQARELFQKAEREVVEEMVTLIEYAASHLASIHICKLCVTIDDCHHSNSGEPTLSLRKISHPGMTQEMLEAVARKLRNECFSITKLPDGSIEVHWD